MSVVPLFFTFLPTQLSATLLLAFPTFCMVLELGLVGYEYQQTLSKRVCPGKESEQATEPAQCPVLVGGITRTRLWAHPSSPLLPLLCSNDKNI